MIRWTMIRNLNGKMVNNKSICSTNNSIKMSEICMQENCFRPTQLCVTTSDLRNRMISSLYFHTECVFEIKGDITFVSIFNIDEHHSSIFYCCFFRLFISPIEMSAWGWWIVKLMISQILLSFNHDQKKNKPRKLFDDDDGFFFYQMNNKIFIYNNINTCIKRKEQRKSEAKGNKITCFTWVKMAFKLSINAMRLQLSLTFVFSLRNNLFILFLSEAFLPMNILCEWVFF